MNNENNEVPKELVFSILLSIGAFCILVLGFVAGLIFTQLGPEYPYNEVLCQLYTEELTVQVDNGHEITIEEGKTLVGLCVKDPDMALVLTTTIDITDAYRNSEYYQDPNK